MAGQPAGGGGRVAAAAVIEAPLGVATQVGQLEAAAEGERDPAGAGLEPGRIAHRALRPHHGVIERGARGLGRRGQAGVADAGEVIAGVGDHRLDGAALAERAQGVERQHVGGALPDRQDLGVAQQLGQAGVLDVAGAAAALDRLRRDRHRLLGGGQLGDRGQRPHQPGLVIGGDAALEAAEHGDGAEREQERAGVLGLEAGQGVGVERLVGEQGAERAPAAGVVAGEVEAAPHAADRAHRVPRAGDRQHRRDGADAVARAADQDRRRAVEGQLRGRHLAGAQLVLEPVDADAGRQPALVVADLDVEQGQATAAVGVAVGAAERERHLGGGRRGEPLGAVQGPATVVPARDRLRQADVGAAGALGHPLARGPRPGRIARQQAGQGALGELAVAALDQRAGGAVGHRQRAGVDVERGAQHVDQGELVDARVRAEAVLVAGGDQAVAGGEPGRLLPQRADLDVIDAAAPRIPRGVDRLVEAIGELEPVQLGRQRAELA